MAVGFGSPLSLSICSYCIAEVKENAERKIPHFRNNIEEIFPQIVDNSLILWYYLRERK